MSAAGGGQEEPLQQVGDSGGPQAAEPRVAAIPGRLQQVGDSGGPQAAEPGDAAIPAAGNGGAPWMLVLSFVILTFNSALALYRSWNDLANAAFILAAYAVLFLLFLCLRRFETTPESSLQQRAHLKMWIWILCSVLVLMFSHRVASVMPFPIAILIWILATLTTGGGFYGLFLYDSKSGDDSAEGDDKKPLKV